ncbi:energy-coupling factor ABC transporter permease [bacterium]|nr:energy-coupling factor ABC transporter permease [bacterium]
MHIPDGFIDTKTAITTATFSFVGLGYALKQVRQNFPQHRIPLIALTAAFVFAAQMLNFPVAGGTSGHLIGAVLASILLGPSAAIIVMATVLILQCFLFADGGLTALGANIFVLGIVATTAGYAIYQLILKFFKTSQRTQFFATACAAWCSTVIASVVCAGILSFSNTIRFDLALPAMTGVHMLIGIGEALITTLVLAALLKLRPELLSLTANLGKTSYKTISLYGLITSLGIALFVAPFASPWPDGLEKVATLLGFEHYAVETQLSTAVLPDYVFPGVS